MKATKLQAKGRIAFIGPAGSGKTYSALLCAQSLQGDGRILMLDSEARSSEKYADKFDFHIISLAPPYSLDTYIKAIKFAGEQDSYSVIIVDSLSHAWAGEGGALEQVDAARVKSRSGNSFTAWKDVTPKQWKMIEAILQNPKHVIGCMRSKMAYEMEKVGDKMQVRKLGMEPIQRAGVEYEFDVVIDMDWDHNAIVSKTRFDDISDLVVNKPDKELFDRIADWLSSGEAERPEPVIEKAEIPQMEPLTKEEKGKRQFTQGDLLGLAKQRFDMSPQEVGQALKAQGIDSFNSDNWDEMVSALEDYQIMLTEEFYPQPEHLENNLMIEELKKDE